MSREPPIRRKTPALVILSRVHKNSCSRGIRLLLSSWGKCTMKNDGKGKVLIGAGSRKSNKLSRNYGGGLTHEKSDARHVSRSQVLLSRVFNHSFGLRQGSVKSNKRMSRQPSSSSISMPVDMDSHDFPCTERAGDDLLPTTDWIAPMIDPRLQQRQR